MKRDEFIKDVTNRVRNVTDAYGDQMFDVTLKETNAYLHAIKESVIDQMKNGDELSWQGFLKFVVADTPARNSRNPQTGEMMVIPAKKKVKVKVLTDLKASVE